MNKNLTGGLIALLIVILGVGAVWAFSDKPGKTLPIGNEPAPTGTSTTVTTSTTTVVVTPTEKDSTVATLNQRILDNSVHITPLTVVEDSRCPVDVQCIQAGTVRITAKLEDATHSETVTMVVGSPVAFGNKHVTLMSVTPAKNSKTTISPKDYRFTFSVAYGMGTEGPPNCCGE